jgi:hypothetical protein
MKRSVQRNSSEVLRDEMFMQQRVTAAIGSEPKTIQEIAKLLDHPTTEVTAWVMAMLRYGQIAPLPKGRTDDYFQYRLTESRS